MDSPGTLFMTLATSGVYGCEAKFLRTPGALLPARARQRISHEPMCVSGRPQPPRHPQWVRRSGNSPGRFSSSRSRSRASDPLRVPGWLRTLWEFTWTLQFKPVPFLMTRLEYRYDKSDKNVFQVGGRPTS